MVAYEAVLDALADRTRRDILEELTNGPMPVADLAGRMPVSRPAVSQHLKVLLGAGLVRFEEHGTRNVYRLDRAGFESLRTWLDRFWDDVLAAFEAYAEQLPDPRSRR